MMNLIRFKDYLGKKRDGKSPPSVIRAKDLDDNFSAVTLVPDRMATYKVDYSEAGSSITFQAGNRSVFWREISVCVDGVEKKMMVLGTEPY